MSIDEATMLPLEESRLQDEPSSRRGYLQEDFRVFRIRDDTGTQVENHYHDFHKLILILAGQGEYTLRGLRYGLQPGDLVLVRAQTAHRPDFPPGIIYERIVFFISEALLRREEEGGCRLEQIFEPEGGMVLRPDPITASRLRRLAVRTVELAGENAFGSGILARAELLALIVTIGRYRTSSPGTLTAPLVSRDTRIGEVLRFIDDELTGELSIDALAERFFISKYHLMRRFREEVGTTIHAYISDKRLLLSRSLIREGMSATEACFASGFSSYSSFARAYRSFFGHSPRAGEGEK